MKSLKQLCDAAREELGWDTPNVYASATDPDGKQTFRLANRQGHDLSQEDVVWQALKTEAQITLVASTQAYALPADYRYMVAGSEWDQDAQRRVLGPLTPRLWAQEEYGGVVFGLNWRYEIRDGDIVFQQAVAAGDAGTVISYEYASSFWALDSGGSGKAEFTLDTDTQRFDDDLFISGIMWRLKQAKGFPYEVELAEYMRRLKRIKARDGGMADIYFIGPMETLDPNIPETNYGL